MSKENQMVDVFSTGTETKFLVGNSRNYWIRILFHGLLAGWIENSQLHVGALNGVTGHNIKLSVDQKGGEFKPIPINGQPIITLRTQNAFPTGISKLRLENIDDRVFDLRGNRAQYYDQVYRQDFRWLLDFEKIHKPDQNGQRLTKRINRLCPQFQLNAGLIYTLVRSIPLQLQRSGKRVYLGRSAQIFAVNIYKTANSNAQLTLGDFWQMTLDREAVYDIVFRNDCNVNNIVQPGVRVDTSELNAAFDTPNAGYYEIQSAIEAMSDAEREWWAEEQRGIDFGRDLGDDYPLTDTRIDPCGEAFFG